MRGQRRPAARRPRMVSTTSPGGWRSRGPDTSLRCSSQPTQSRRRGADAASALLGDDRHDGVDERRGRPRRGRAARVALVAGRSCASTLGRRRGAAPRAWRPGAGCAGTRRARRRTTANDAGGPPLGRRHRVDAQPGLGDDAERALAADEELGEVGAGGGARRRAAGADDAAVGQHDLEADDHVLDLAVAGRVLAGAAAGQPPADRRQRRSTAASGRAVTPWAARRSSSSTSPNVPARTSSSSDVVVDVDDAGSGR